MIYLASLTEEIGDKVKGYYPIKTKEDLDKVICNNKQSNTIIIRRDFAKEYFTPSGLHQYILNARSINRNISIQLDEDSMVLTKDRMLSKMADIRDAMDIIDLVSAYPKEFIDSINYLLRDEQSHQKELLNASGDVSKLQAIIDGYIKDVDNLQHRLKIEQENKFYVQSKLNVLTRRLNDQYDAKVKEKQLFVVNGHNYDKVLYFKEITRVQYMDSFIYYLKEILKILYGMPSRAVVIEGYYASGKERLYKGYKPHYKLIEEDVLSNDILMLGMQPKLMQDILHNPSNISVLIVLDRAGFISPHIKGSNIEYFYTASDKDDIPKNVPNERIISYNDDTLFIPMIEGYADLDDGERISKYSSLEIIKKIISIVEGR
ncbi:MAG: hypothetical protein IJE43_18940 [Alphaproteobacteria bacterium]|nr:hypothetical protein [Alphaproteobacteria bacterium]